jgi:hypothetical protein
LLDHFSPDKDSGNSGYNEYLRNSLEYGKKCVEKKIVHRRSGGLSQNYINIDKLNIYRGIIWERGQN